MSLKKGSRRTSSTPENPGRQTPGGGTPSESAQEDPLDRMFAPSEDSDWEETFLSVIRPASSSTPAPSSSGKAEDEDPSENTDQEQDRKPNEVQNSNRLNASNSQPIELLNENSQVVEVDVPVMEGVPSGSFKPLWSQEFISCTSPTTHRCVPLYKVEGREDPEKDEGFNEPESPFKSSPMLSGGDDSSANREIRHNDANNSQEEPGDSPNHPENFFDKCDILQWVINDSNISDPKLLNTSPTHSTDDEQRPTATTTRFISERKRDLPTPPEQEATNQPTNSEFAAATHTNSSSTTAEDLQGRMVVAAKPQMPGNAAKELHHSVVQALNTNPSTLATQHGSESNTSQMLGIEVPAVAGPSNLPPVANQQSTLPDEGLFDTLSLDPEIKSEPDPDWDDQPPKLTGSRKRGRPSLPSGVRPITPHPSTTATAADLTEDEASAQKFRRMRDLNNEASRRCRENRKLKQEEAERELQELMVINQERRRMVAEMERQVQEMKARILQDVSGSSRLLQQRSPPGQQNNSPPNLSSMWSDM